MTFPVKSAPLWVAVCVLFMSVVACNPEVAAEKKAEAEAEHVADSLAIAELDYTIDPHNGFGPIDASADLASLQAKFGQENVKAGDVYLGEGTVGPGAIVFPNTPEQVEVYFGTENSGEPGFARTEETDSKWRTANGLHIGSSLAELNRLNGTPVSFYGFDWDYGGSVADWHGGKFANSRLQIRLAYPDSVQLDPAFVGDQLVENAVTPELAAQIYVQEITVRFERPAEELTPKRE